MTKSPISVIHLCLRLKNKVKFHSHPCDPRNFFFCAYGDLSGIGKDSSPESSVERPEEPTNCCMSGCANCVWIDYAEELMELFKDGAEKSKEVIIDKVKDPNMQAFLLTELNNMQKPKN